MNEKNYQKQIAKLETINDMLQSEFNNLNKLLVTLGFEKGLKTLKDAANEMLDERRD